MADAKWQTPSKRDTVKAMQVAAFTKNWDLFRSFFTDDVYYRVGNVVETNGADSVANYLRELPATELKITEQDVRENWETPTEVLAEYTMRGFRLSDHQGVEYPCMDIYRFRGDKFADWRVYPMEPTFVAPDSTLSFKRPSGIGQMLEPAASASLGTVQTFQAAVREGKWSLAKSLLTEQVVLRVADQSEVSGPGATLERLRDVFTQLRPTGATFIGVWAFNHVLVTEMKVQATRVLTGQQFEYPCVETYRFAGGKIREWRIYPVEATLLARARTANGLPATGYSRGPEIELPRR